jgi:hypothetical protein
MALCLRVASEQLPSGIEESFRLLVRCSDEVAGGAKDILDHLAVEP